MKLAVGAGGRRLVERLTGGREDAVRAPLLAREDREVAAAPIQWQQRRIVL
jgi:hypothetical protein